MLLVINIRALVLIIVVRSFFFRETPKRRRTVIGGCFCKMKFVSFSECSLEGKTLIIPSCGCSAVDQLAIDLICYKFGKQVGRFISENIDQIVSPNPYKKDGEIATTIDVYTATLKNLGECVIFRIASSIPKEKRKILEFSKDICEFVIEQKISGLLMLRSVSSVFCLEQQIRDWPFALRVDGPLSEKIGFKAIEQYTDTQLMMKNTVFGDLHACIEKLGSIQLTTCIFFVHEGKGFNEAMFFAKKVTQEETFEIPYSWVPLMEE